MGEDQNRECDRESRTIVNRREDQNSECERVSGTIVNGREDQNRECEGFWDKSQ